MKLQLCGALQGVEDEPVHAFPDGAAAADFVRRRVTLFGAACEPSDIAVTPMRGGPGRAWATHAVRVDALGAEPVALTDGPIGA